MALPSSLTSGLTDNRVIFNTPSFPLNTHTHTETHRQTHTCQVDGIGVGVVWNEESTEKKYLYVERRQVSTGKRERVCDRERKRERE